MMLLTLWLNYICSFCLNLYRLGCLLTYFFETGIFLNDSHDVWILFSVFMKFSESEIRVVWFSILYWGMKFRCFIWFVVRFISLIVLYDYSSFWSWFKFYELFSVFLIFCTFELFVKNSILFLKFLVWLVSSDHADP